jgi:hypothetical protein
MIELSGDVDVRGPFETQPRLVKIGGLVLFAASVIFGIYLPTALAVAVIAGVGTPAPNWKGTAGALCFTAGLSMIGAWITCRFLRWFRGRDISLVICLACFGAGIIGSAVLSSATVAFHIWPPVTAVAIALFFLGIFIGGMLIKVEQAIASRR